MLLYCNLTQTLLTNGCLFSVFQISCHNVGSKTKTLTAQEISVGRNSVEFVPPQPLSPEEVKLISDQCDQRFIKLHVSRILEDQVYV